MTEPRDDVDDRQAEHRAECLDEHLDERLRRAFSPPDDAGHRALDAMATGGLATGALATGARRRVLVAAAAVLLAAGIVWGTLASGNQTAVASGRLALDEVYKQLEYDASIKIGTCTTEAAKKILSSPAGDVLTMDPTKAQGVLGPLPAEPWPGASYLATPGANPVIVVALPPGTSADVSPDVPVGCVVNLFERELACGFTVLELSPHAAPRYLDWFAVQPAAAGR